MPNKVYFYVIALFAGTVLNAQITLPAYIDGKNEEEAKSPNFMCLQSEVAKFIARKTDSVFVEKAMNSRRLD